MKFNHLFYNKNARVLLVVNAVLFAFFKNIIGDAHAGKTSVFKHACVSMNKTY